MRAMLAALVGLLAAIPALADTPETQRRVCVIAVPGSATAVSQATVQQVLARSGCAAGDVILGQTPGGAGAVVAALACDLDAVIDLGDEDKRVLCRYIGGTRAAAQPPRP